MKCCQLTFEKVCLSGGVILIALSLVLLVFWQKSVYSNEKRNQAYVDTLIERIPERQAAVMEARTNNMMPSFCINDHNFVAIMELPANGAIFPVGASWESHNDYPSRYAGSVYDGSLVIGATNQKGQLEFVKEISVGNKVYLTDMTGDCYSFEVFDIQYRKHADNDSLFSDKDDLTIFVKNIFEFEYIIFRCKG